MTDLLDDECHFGNAVGALALQQSQRLGGADEDLGLAVGYVIRNVVALADDARGLSVRDLGGGPRRVTRHLVSVMGRNRESDPAVPEERTF